MSQDPFLELFVLAERLHRQFLDFIQAELDALQIRDINNVRAVILLNIGESEMTASELLWRGCYLGSNVSYNLKKLTEAGYVVQTRSDHDRRVIMVRNSQKGADLCARLQEMNAHHLDAMGTSATSQDDLARCGKTLRNLQQLWSRAGETRGNLGGTRQPAQVQFEQEPFASALRSNGRDADGGQGDDFHLPRLNGFANAGMDGLPSRAA